MRELDRLSLPFTHVTVSVGYLTHGMTDIYTHHVHKKLFVSTK
jgi:hypothetical protein